MITLKAIKSLGSHSGPVYALCSAGQYGLFSGGSDKIVGNWNLESLSPAPMSVKSEHAVYSLAYHSSSCLFIATSTGDLHWIDLNLKQEVKLFKLHKSAIYSLCVFGDLLISGDGKGLIAVWDIYTKSLLRQFPLGDSKIRSITHNGDESLISICCGDGLIHVLDTDFNEVNTLKGHEKSVNTSLFIGRQLVSGGWDGHLRLWDLDSNDLIKKVPAHNFAIYDLNQLEGYLLSASRDKTIKIWDYELNPIQKLDFKIGGHNRSVNRLVLEDEKLFSTGDDGRVIAWGITIQ